MCNSTCSCIPPITVATLITSAMDAACLDILSPYELERECISTELVDAGWQIAEYPNTGYRILVRPKSTKYSGQMNGKFNTEGSRYLRGWNLFVIDLESREIDTGVEHDPKTDRPAIVAKVGKKTKKRFYTRYENVDFWDSPCSK
jgi:hypothetical protein